MKVKRIVSGLILLLILSIILILGNTTVVNIAISAVAIITINEYFNSFNGKYNADKWVGTIMAILLAFIGFLPKEMLVLIFPIAIALLFTKVVVTRNENKLYRYCNIRIWNNIHYWIYNVYTTFIC
jgi:CDP-diglyceride synthetase